MLRIIKKGAVKVFLSDDDEIVIDYKSEGDSFGYVSLISGDKSRANVLTMEDTLCYKIPREIILKIINQEPHFSEFFMKSFFKTYLDKTYKEMRNKNLLFKEGDKLLYTTLIENLLAGNAIEGSESLSIKEAASIMSENGISSLIITDGQNAPSGIVTDRDLRDKVLARDMDPARPINEIMSTELVTIDSQQTCFDALSIMMRHKIHHLIVTARGKLKGVVTNHDFMMLQGTSPLSILKNIERQKSAEELLTNHHKISQVITILIKEGVRAGHILRIITELHDRLLQRIITFSLDKIGAPPEPFSFFVYGNEGRKEQTFKTVFHFAICYENHKSHSSKQEMKQFCDKLFMHLQELFLKCGLPVYGTNPFGDEAAIHNEISAWQTHILDALRSGNSKLVNTSRKFLDMRVIYGDEAIVESLKNSLYQNITGDDKLNSALVDPASHDRSPVGFFKKFIVDEKGKPMEQFNIKEKGIAQIVDSVRALAISNNIHETSTIERLALLSKNKVLSDIHNDIHSAFEFLLHLRLEDQVMKKEQNTDMDDIIEPEKLTLLEKKMIREIFKLITRLQDAVTNSINKHEAIA